MRILLLFVTLFLTACGSQRFEQWSNRDTPSSQVNVPPPAPSPYQSNPQRDLEPIRPQVPRSQIETKPIDLPQTPPQGTQTPIQPAPPPSALPPEKKVVTAALPPSRPTPPAAPPPPLASAGSTGTYSVSDAGDQCKLTLSSQDFFEYKRASSNCKSPSLANVNAWEKKGNEITLYERGGKVAARVFGSGSKFEGATTRGANITMSK